jgi:phenylacetate-CoA ligase
MSVLDTRLETYERHCRDRGLRERRFPGVPSQTDNFEMSTASNLLGALPRLAQLMRSQYWSAGQHGSYRSTQLERTLQAAAAIPFYKSRLGGVPRAAELKGLPILRRGDLMELNRSVRTLHGPDAKFLRAKSSGSTGQSVELLFDDSHQRGRFAARARYLFANGWRAKRSAWLIDIRPGSPDGNLVHGRFVPGAKFLSHLAEFETQIAWLRELKPHFLYAMPSSLEALLIEFEKQRARLPSLRRVFTGGEVLEDSIRERTRRVLGVEISDNYGSTEAFLGWQCPRGGYHINSEHVLIELVDESGRAVPTGGLGRVLITTLENRLMPLIRYDLGDYAVAMEERCSCGRTLPLIGKILGRGINLFRLRDGRILSPWKLVDPLKALPEVKQVQIVQEAVDRYTVRFVAETSLEPNVENAMRKGFLEIVGADAAVTFARVADIPRTAGGKFMAALSMLPGTPSP